jgi:hypothetical protein
MWEFCPIGVSDKDFSGSFLEIGCVRAGALIHIL